METTLHRQLKCQYASSEADVEVAVGDFRVDAVRDGELVEVQFASLSAIRRKAERLLQRHRLRIVKPVIHRTRIIRLDRAGGKQQSRRLSPKRGSILDVFDDLIYFTRVFPHPSLTLEILLVDVEEMRVPRRRSRRWHPDHRVTDVRLDAIERQFEAQSAGQLLDLLHWANRPDTFTTADLAVAIDRPRWFAQKVAYVLRKVGAIEQLRRTRAGIVYRAGTDALPAFAAAA